LAYTGAPVTLAGAPDPKLVSYLNLWSIWIPIAAKFLNALTIAYGIEASV